MIDGQSTVSNLSGSPSCPPAGDCRLQATAESRIARQRDTRQLKEICARHMCFVVGDRYAKNAGAVLSLKQHIVWCPKYPRSVLTHPIDARLKALSAGIAAEHGMRPHAVEVMPDHVHLFVEPDPRLCVAEIVNPFKGRTSGVLRQEFASLRSRLPTLWSRSSFAATVGAVSQTTIRGDIEAPKGG